MWTCQTPPAVEMNEVVICNRCMRFCDKNELKQLYATVAFDAGRSHFVAKSKRQTGLPQFYQEFLLIKKIICIFVWIHFFFFLSLIAVNSYLMIFAAENWSVGGFIQHRGVKNELMSLSNGKCQTGNDRMKHGHTACLWHEEDFIRKNQACRMCNDDKVDRLVDDDTKKNMHRKWTINGNYFISMHNMYGHWALVSWTPHHNDDELEAIHRAPS